MKTALITGASRGIGKTLALAVARAGYRVVVNCQREAEKARAVVDEIKTAGGHAEVFVADVRDSLKVRQMIGFAAGLSGGLDLLINNAGITRDRTILKMTNGEWNDVIDTNLSGVFWCLREAARTMAEQKRGAIINVSSIMASRASIGTANYSAAKAGVIALTKTAARELGRFGVRVNAVFPGFHPTDMGAALPKEQLERVQAEHTLGHSTSPQDLASMILALAENESISGQVFNIDSRVMG